MGRSERHQPGTGRLGAGKVPGGDCGRDVAWVAGLSESQWWEMPGYPANIDRLTKTLGGRKNGKTCSPKFRAFAKILASLGDKKEAKPRLIFSFITSANFHVGARTPVSVKTCSRRFLLLTQRETPSRGKGA